MLTIYYTTRFKRDFKRIRKKHKNLRKLQAVIELLVDEKTLDSRYKDHRLIGNWANHRECHIEPDWLLIYRITDNNLYIERTGSHAELFKK
ncbi:MAG: type II toxin-antitoxin system YafQ family toxin [Candidatus Electrothrix communis]|nr:MAG: type II toxin-antitoxin system YafQ family toxin [Candidatus Electrothrix communis]